MNITNGTVTYSRTVKPADYEGKTGTVELSFVLEDGDDAEKVLATVGNMAKARALALVDIQPKTAATTATAEKQPTKEAAAAAINAEDEAKKAAAAKAKADKAAAAKAAKEAEAAKTKEADDLTTFDEDAAPAPEITDKALTEAMTAKMLKLKEKHGGAAPVKIKELIAKFVEPPKKSADIPQNARPEFLKKLEALE